MYIHIYIGKGLLRLFVRAAQNFDLFTPISMLKFQRNYAVEIPSFFRLTLVGKPTCPDANVYRRPAETKSPAAMDAVYINRRNSSACPSGQLKILTSLCSNFRAEISGGTTRQKSVFNSQSHENLGVRGYYAQVYHKSPRCEFQTYRLTLIGVGVCPAADFRQEAGAFHAQPLRGCRLYNRRNCSVLSGKPVSNPGFQNDGGRNSFPSASLNNLLCFFGLDAKISLSGSTQEIPLRRPSAPVHFCEVLL